MTVLPGQRVYKRSDGAGHHLQARCDRQGYPADPA